MSTFWQNRRHARVRTLLSSYIDGEVSASEARRVAAHLSGCDECVAELESLRATTTLLGRLPSLDTPRSYALTAADVQDMSPRRGLPSFAAFSGGLATAGAAALVVVLVVGVVFLARLGFMGSLLLLQLQLNSLPHLLQQPLLRLPKRPLHPLLRRPELLHLRPLLRRLQCLLLRHLRRGQSQRRRLWLQLRLRHRLLRQLAHRPLLL